MSTEVEPPARCPNCDRVMALATKMVLAATEVSAEEIMRLRMELAAAKAQIMANCTPSFGLTVEQEHSIRAVVDELVAKGATDCLVVGKVYRHPHNCRLMRVTEGSYLGGYERVSNFWYWSYLDEEFSLVGEQGQGYGWTAKPIEEPQS